MTIPHHLAPSDLKTMWTKMMPLEELLSDMRRLRNVGAFHDVYFLVEKKKIPAHKVSE